MPAADRRLLVAHMAAVRARLLHELLGLDETALMTGRLYGDWTSANLLAHLGEHDQCYADMTTRALAGRLSTEGVDYSDIRDHLLRERVGAWSLEQSIALMTRGRAAFLEALAAADDDSLGVLQRFPWKFGQKTGRSQGTLAAWARQRALHDAGHIEDITAWRKTLGPAEGAPSRPILAVALRAAHDDFWASAAFVPAGEEARRPVSDDRTLVELLVHLAERDRATLRQLRAMIGEPDTEAAVPRRASNTRSAAVSFTQAADDLRRGQAVLLEEINAVSEEMLADIFGSEGSSYPTAYHALWAALEDTLEQAAELRASLRLPLPKYLLTFKSRSTV